MWQNFELSERVKNFDSPFLANIAMGLGGRLFLAVAALLVVGTVVNAALKAADLECMFLGYPDLEYDGFDRTEVIVYL